MNYLNRYTPGTFLRELCLIIVAVVWWIPFFLLLVVAFKPAAEGVNAPFAPPTQLDLDNFGLAWQGSGGVGLGTGLVNSLVITAGSVLALISVGSISAYVIAR